MKKRITKLAALLLSAAMVITMIPMSAFAKDTYKYELSEIASQLVDGMVKRSDSVKLYYKAKDVINMGELEDLTFSYSQDNPFAGDYLKYTVDSCERSSISGVKSGSYIYQAFTMKISYVNNAEEQQAIESCINGFVENSQFNRVDRDYYKAYEAYKFVVSDSGSSLFSSLNALDSSLKKALILYAACNSVSINCRIVTSGSHYWNIIKIGDNWYNADASKESGTDEFAYFLVNDSAIGESKDAESRELASCPSDYIYEYEPIEARINNVKSTGKLDITWNHLPDVAEYNIVRRTEDTEYEHYATVSHGYILDENVEVGKEYMYLVIPVMENGEQYQSDEKHRYADLARPAISATKKNGKIKISWSSITDAKKYYVYRSTKKSSGYKKIGTTTKRSYIDSKGKKGKKYYYKVVAGSGMEHGDSYPSNIVSKRK